MTQKTGRKTQDITITGIDHCAMNQLALFVFFAHCLVAVGSQRMDGSCNESFFVNRKVTSLGR